MPLFCSCDYCSGPHQSINNNNIYSKSRVRISLKEKAHDLLAKILNLLPGFDLQTVFDDVLVANDSHWHLI